MFIHMLHFDIEAQLIYLFYPRIYNVLLILVNI